MNSSVIPGTSQQGLDALTWMDQYDFMDPFDEDLAGRFESNYHGSFISPSTNSMESSSAAIDDNYSNFSTIHNMDALSFGNQIHSLNFQQVNTGPLNPMEEDIVSDILKSEKGGERVQPKKKKRIRPPSQTYDHIMAERRRREQLSQLFVALSALIPGLKKMDKSSILEDTIKYMKHLQERVKVLEEEAERKPMESAVIVKKTQIVFDDDDVAASDEQSSSFEEQKLPQIEARVCDNHMLLKVHCDKQKDVLAQLICKVESLNMTVVTTNSTTFGGVALDITIVAEMEKEFNMTPKEVVTSLRAALEPVA